MSSPSVYSVGMSEDAKCSHNPTSSPPSSTKPFGELMRNYKPDGGPASTAPHENYVRSPSPLCATELINALAYLRSSSSLVGVPPPVDHTLETTRRILEWRQDVDDDDDMYVHVVRPSDPILVPIGKHAPGTAWISFLPSFRSSSPRSSVSSLSSGEGEVRPSVEVRVEHSTVSEESLEPAHAREDAESRSHVSEDTRCSDEVITWPYDGRGLYEHHSKYDCGQACFAACQRRRKFRPGKTSRPRVLGSLARLLGKRVGSGEPEQMMNSDVPHPPWWLEYRSNDDTLGEEDDDGDLELWLEHTTQRQQMDHELRFRLLLNQKPDSRIFWF